MISLCMIVKDEESNLPRCLKSVAAAVDEMIVVDTGSTDATGRIAKSFGAKVKKVPWADDFSAARNASLELAKGDWILFLDADEELEAGGAEVLRRLVSASDVEGYFVKIVSYLGQGDWVEACPDVAFRLFRNRPEYRFHGAVHEQIVDVIQEKRPQAKCEIVEDLTLFHYGYLDEEVAGKGKKARNLTLLEKEVAARPDDRLLRYHYGVELFRAARYGAAAVQFVAAGTGLDPRTVFLPKLMRYLVLSYQGDHQPEKAMEVARTGAELFPEYADLYHFAGMVAYDHQAYGLAYELFQQALVTPEQKAYYASFPGTRGFRTFYQLGRLAERFCNLEAAMRFYLSSLRDNPSFTPALDSIVRLLEPHRDPVYAKECLAKTCVLMTPQANLAMGQILFRHHAYGLALEFLERGRTPSRPPAPEELLCKAICLFQVKRFPEALKLFDQLGKDPKMRPVALLNETLHFWFQGNRPRVQALAEELLALGATPGNSLALNLLERSLGPTRGPKVTLDTEGITFLLDLLQRVLALGESARVQRVLDRLRSATLKRHALLIAKLFQRWGHAEIARHYLELRLADHLQCADTTFALAEIMEEAGEYFRAADLYRETLALEPKEPRAYARLIGVYDKLRREVLRTAAERYPEAEALQTLLKEAQDES